MSTVIIIGSGGGHNSITRIVVAGVQGKMTAAQEDLFNQILAELEALASEVESQ